MTFETPVTGAPMSATWSRIAIGAVLGFLAFGAPIAAAQSCPGPLTGPVLRLTPDVKAFGKVYGLPPLPLGRLQYVVTIDDGPNPTTTPRLLDILRDHCVRATFFLVGRNAEAHPDLVQRILSEGHTLGTHSYSHPDLAKLTSDQIDEEISKGIKAVAKAAEGAPGGPPDLSLFRYPGSSNVPLIMPKPWLARANGDGLVVAGIDFSPQDWRNSPPEESLKRLMGNFGERGVIVFHDGMPNTIGLLPMVLDQLQGMKAQITALQPVPSK